MDNKVTIHQVNYLPWIGFFDKIAKADTFVLFDTADLEKNSVQNRNKIRTRDGSIFLTIPVPRQYYMKPFHEAMLSDDNSWMKKHWKSIEMNYSKAPYFQTYRDFFEKLYTSDIKNLSEFNEKMIRFLIKEFGIDVNIVKSSEMDIDNSLKKTDLLLDILKKSGATTYLSGPSGRDYLQKDKFPENSIKLEFHDFKHPEYKQVFQPFMPGMAAIDLLFNEGENSRRFFK